MKVRERWFAGWEKALGGGLIPAQSSGRIPLLDPRWIGQRHWVFSQVIAVWSMFRFNV
jgi:hypothetical protein